MNKKAPPFKS